MRDNQTILFTKLHQLWRKDRVHPVVDFLLDPYLVGVKYKILLKRKSHVLGQADFPSVVLHQSMIA